MKSVNYKALSIHFFLIVHLDIPQDRHYDAT